MRSSLVKRAAIAQLCSTSDKLSNLAAVAKCAGMAKKAGASMLFLPECFGFLGENSEQTIKHSEPPITANCLNKSNDKSYIQNLDKMNQSLCHELASIVTETYSSSDDELSGKNKYQPYEAYPGLLSLKKKFHDDIDSKRLMNDWRLIPALQTIARESGLWISAGGMHERTQDYSQEMNYASMKVHNTHVILNSSGSIVTAYRKIHLFDVHIPTKNINLRESATTVPGKKLVVCETPLGILGLSTCYDLRFPEMFTALVRDGNAQLIAVPSAFTVPTGRAHWHTLLKARAIENQCFVIAAAQVGRHNQKRESYGHALGVGPWGGVLADAGGGEGSTNDVAPPSIVVCDIDLEDMDNVRERMPIQKHRDDSVFSF